MRRAFKVSSGFSLIELLVVIAIIGILATIIIASVSKSRASARDARRYADLSQIQIALEAYYNLNSSYPSTGGAWYTVCTNGANSTAYTTSGSSGYVPDLAPAFISALPTDPSGCTGIGTYHGYMYRSDGANYKIAADGTAEPGIECAVGKTFYDSRGSGFCSLSTPAAAAW